MLDPIANHMKGKRNRLPVRLGTGCAIDEDARQGWDFTDPATIFLAINLNHSGRTVFGRFRMFAILHGRKLPLRHDEGQ